MVTCAAYGCSNRPKKDSGISFFKFPKDPLTYKAWINKLNRANFTPTGHSRVCSVHFELYCFYMPVDDLARFGYTRGVNCLKVNAVPTIFDRKQTTASTHKQKASTEQQDAIVAEVVRPAYNTKHLEKSFDAGSNKMADGESGEHSETSSIGPPAIVVLCCLCGANVPADSGRFIFSSSTSHVIQILGSILASCVSVKSKFDATCQYLCASCHNSLDKAHKLGLLIEKSERRRQNILEKLKRLHSSFKPNTGGPEQHITFSKHASKRKADSDIVTQENVIPGKYLKIISTETLPVPLMIGVLQQPVPLPKVVRPTDVGQQEDLQSKLLKQKIRPPVIQQDDVCHSHSHIQQTEDGLSKILQQHETELLKIKQELLEERSDLPSCPADGKPGALGDDRLSDPSCSGVNADTPFPMEIFKHGATAIPQENIKTETDATESKNLAVTLLNPVNLLTAESTSAGTSSRKVTKGKHADEAQTRSSLFDYKLHLVKKPYKCPRCDYASFSQNELDSHMKSHISAKSFVCSVCSSGFGNKVDLVLHMQIHGSQHFTCSLCGHVSNDSTSDAAHRKTHSAEKSHKCPICDYRASCTSNIAAHIKTHTGEKPYKCPYCDYRCITNPHLKRHIVTHSRKKKTS